MKFEPLSQHVVDAARLGKPDANGQVPERAVSDGVGTPCRCCLKDIPEGAEMLILAARPFPDLNPYAETGPIFLCAENCTPWGGEGLAPILTTSPDYLIKAYSKDHRIVYGTGQITISEEIEHYIEGLFARTEVAYVDLRSARNNCFLTRTYRA